MISEANLLSYHSLAFSPDPASDKSKSVLCVSERSIGFHISRNRVRNHLWAII